jgi:glycosyltransferase involved in cell wall biosynthesis
VKILVIGGKARSLIRFRGPLLRAMVERGHRVVAAAPADEPDIEARLAEIGVRFDPLRLDRTGTDPVRDIRLLRRLLALFRHWKPERVLLYNIKPVIYGSLAALQAGISDVYSIITGLGHVFVSEGLRGAALRLGVVPMYRAALRGNRAVIFQNPDDEEDFDALGLLPVTQPRVRVAGSGVDLDYYAPVALPEGPPVFLFSGRLLREKGLVEYVEAARRLRARHPQVRAQVLGFADANPSSLRVADLEAWEREGVIEHLGAVEDVRPHVARATVAVLPSYREGTPRSLLEAMAMGRPVVTTDVPGCRQVVEEGSNGLLVPARDPRALANAMERFVAEPELKRSMGLNGRRLAVECFDVREVSRRILDAMELP